MNDPTFYPPAGPSSIERVRIAVVLRESYADSMPEFEDVEELLKAYDELREAFDRHFHEQGEVAYVGIRDYAAIKAQRDEMDAALAVAWGALMWIKNYDSEDGTLAHAISEIERVRKAAGTRDYDAMRAEVEAARLELTRANANE